jgi:2-dehydro-3-deoxy-D-arabinonate dehydratase
LNNKIFKPKLGTAIMKLYKTSSGIILNSKGLFYMFKQDWDLLINRNHLHDYLQKISHQAYQLSMDEAYKLLEDEIMPPVGRQEVWAAGVTYLRSRDARMEESQQSGGASLYDRIYEAERPELFFKSLPHRVAGQKQDVYIRRDSSWNVPEPELTLFINSVPAALKEIMPFICPRQKYMKEVLRSVLLYIFLRLRLIQVPSFE